MRLSVRTLVELVALAAIAVGLWDLHRSSGPPGPLLAALRRGDETERIAALRGLALLGDEGGVIVPDMVLAARHDPSPAVRRGAIYALTRIALVEPAADLPIAAVLTPPVGGLPGPPRLGLSRRELPMLRPRADEVAAALEERMRADPDPSVRAFALRALRSVLNAAVRERSLARAKLRPGKPVPPHEASGDWVESAVLAAADRTRDPSPEVVGHALGFIGSSEPARDLLQDDRRAEALAAPIVDDAPALPAELEVLALVYLARTSGADHPAAPRLVALLAERVADPPPLGPPGSPPERRIAFGRTAYAVALWGLVPSAEFLAEHPGVADVLIPFLSGDHVAYLNHAHRSAVEHSFQRRTNAYTADIFNGSGTTWFGGGPSFPDPRDAALDACIRDPRILGLVWPRVDRAGRLGWLADEFDNIGLSRSGWQALNPILHDPGVRADLPPEEAGAVLDRLLDEPGPAPDEDDEDALEKLIREIEHLRRGQPEGESATTPVEAARLLRTARNLAVLCYFARAADPQADAVSRLVDRLLPLLDAVEPSARARAASLLGSLGTPAAPARPALVAQAADDPDEAARQAAEEALRLLDATGPLPPDASSPRYSSR